MFQHPRMARALAGARPWYELKAADGGDVDELFIYDEVAWYAVDAKKLVGELSNLTASTLRVRINSPGGSVFDGLAIYNALRRHSARVEVRVEGLAASIASIIALAGDHVAIEPSAFMMIHDPWAVAIGNATELRELADTLDKIGDQLLAIYARKTGKPEAELAELLAAETWLNADDARELGLVDEVLDDEADPSARVRFDLRGFANPPAELVEPAKAESAETPPAETTDGQAEEPEPLEAGHRIELDDQVDEPETPEPVHPLNVELLRRRLAIADDEPHVRH
jgi:ATP-dependent Clp endopeptidase proteolytic subunit ClpP